MTDEGETGWRDARNAAASDVPSTTPGEDAALAAAAKAAQRVVDASYLVGERGSVLRLDDLTAMHYLRRRGQEFDYCARIEVDGVLPRCVCVRRGFALDEDDLPAHVPQLQELASEVEVRTRAPALVRAFSTPALVDCVPEYGFRVAWRPGHETTVAEIDVDVGNAQSLERAVRFACVVGRIARALAESRVVFAEHALDARPPVERVLEVLDRVTRAVAWLSGPTARVGDGVEARLVLDEQPDLPSVLRIDIDGEGRHSLFFEGRFTHAFPTIVQLTPQRGLVDRLRGLGDAKSGDAAFDDTWLCAGDGATLQLLAARRSAFRLLAAAGAGVELGPAGLVVRVPPIGGIDVIELVGAVLGLWRTLVRHQHGRDQGEGISPLVRRAASPPVDD